MSFTGDLWSPVNRVASQARMNLKTALVGTGDQILAKSAGSLQVGQIASVTADSTGGSLKAGIHRWNGTTWVTPTGGIHYHTSNADGGTFQDLLIKAIQNTWFANFPSVTASDFKQSGTGTPVFTSPIVTTDTYAMAATSATTTHSANFRYGGFTIAFNSPAAFVTRIQLADTTTQTQARCGINMEVAEATTDNKPKFGFEGCATCNSSSMSIISSDNTTRSKNTSSADNYATVGNFMMQLTPGVDVKYRKETGTIITKVSNVPSSGVSDRSNTFVAGIQTAANVSKNLKIYAFQAVGKIGETMPTI